MTQKVFVPLALGQGEGAPTTEGRGVGGRALGQGEGAPTTEGRGVGGHPG